MTGLAASFSSRVIIAAVWLSASCIAGTAWSVIDCALSTMSCAPIVLSSTLCSMDMVWFIASPKYGAAAACAAERLEENYQYMMKTTPMITVHSATAAHSVSDEGRSMPPRASFRRSSRYSRSASSP